MLRGAIQLTVSPLVELAGGVLPRIGPHLERGRGELMPLDWRGHNGLPGPAGYRNVMNGRDDISQFMPGQRRQQAQRRLMCLCRDLDQVVVGWLFIGAPVQSAPDALNRAGSLQALKPAP